jgi:hypothetical protein
VLNVFQKIFGDQELDDDCFKQFLVEYENAKDTESEKLIKDADEETIQAIVDGEWWEIEQIFGYLGIFGIFLNQPKLIDSLRACFK